MSESTLAITLTDIQDAVCNYCGYGADYSALTAGSETAEVDGYIKRGLRQFYWPIGITGRMHRWSFLRPTQTIYLYPTMTEVCQSSTVTSTGDTLTSDDTDDLLFYTTMVGESLVAADGTSYTISAVASEGASACTVSSDSSADDNTAFTITADGDYPLPDDFGQIEGTFRFPVGTGYAAPILVGEADIRQKRVISNETGFPRYVAIRPKTTTNASGQRFELCVFPTPDAVYAMTYRYSVLPNALVSSTNEYPYGGAMHGETILQSCLAAAEAGINDAQGTHKALFLERLKVSIDADLQASVPDRIGVAAMRPSVSGATLGDGWTLTYDNAQAGL